MKMNHIFFIFIIFISITLAETSVYNYSKRGCSDMCGNVRIPFPFGMEPNCYLNNWYAVECNSSKVPYLLKNLPLLGVDLNEQMVLVSVSMMSNCQSPIWNSSQIVNLSDSPFLFSKSHNKFIVKGCGLANIFTDGIELQGCTETVCSQKSVGYGTNECQTNIDYYLENYSVIIKNNKSCLSAFLTADTWYINHLLSGKSVAADNSLIPVVLRWTLTAINLMEVGCDYNFSKHGLQKADGTSVDTWKCSCNAELEKGNPYLPSGCKECTKNDGSNHNFHNDASKSTSSRARSIVLGVGISIVVLILIAIGFTILYKLIKRAKDKRRKKRFFERNGGLLLKQQEAGNEGLVNKTKLFTSNELEKATNCFHENNIIGRGGQGIVYKGMLTDGRIVAIKKSKAVDQSQLGLFINEMVILSQVNHRNIVKLLGFCLETDVPILVSEFIPNGTLYDHIHCETPEVFFSLKMRLQISIEVSGAISYLHSATSVPIYHRDIKSTNILLDEKYRAKISDFGTSRFVSISQTHLTTLVHGTMGYMDPEYFQSSLFTEKSDVYSFGVVLVELLTGENPICLSRIGGNRNLASHFIMAFEEERVISILDAKMVTEGGRDVVMALVNLAMRCLDSCGKNRPTMKEVASELETIRMSHMTTCNGGEQDLLMLSYGEPISSNIL